MKLKAIFAAEQKRELPFDLINDKMAEVFLSSTLDFEDERVVNKINEQGFTVDPDREVVRVDENIVTLKNFFSYMFRTSEITYHLGVHGDSTQLEPYSIFA